MPINSFLNLVCSTEFTESVKLDKCVTLTLLTAIVLIVKTLSTLAQKDLVNLVNIQNNDSCMMIPKY